LRVASAIMLKNEFHCPYCGEPTKMEVRDRSLGRIDSPAGGAEG